MGTEMDTSGNRTALGVSADVAQLVGSRIRQAREATGRSTSALSAKIKVREHYLVAIEDGHWNELPPGLNGRGLVRIYARELSVPVPELDQAANQSVMPAEHDAQAPYQVGQTRESRTEREFGAQRVMPVPDTPPARVHEAPVKTNTLNSASNQQRATQELQQPRAQSRPNRAASVTAAHRELTPEEEPLDVTTPDVASILGISLDVIDDNRSNQTAPVKQQSAQTVRGAETVKREAIGSVRDTEEAVLPLGTDVSSEPLVSSHRDEVLAEHSRQKSTSDHKNSQRKSFKKTHKPKEISSQPPAPVVASVETASVSSEPVVASVETASVSSEPVVASIETAPVSSEPAVASVETVSVVSEDVPSPEATESVTAAAADAALESETAPGIAAAEAYLKSHEAEAVAVESDVQKLGTVNSTKIRWAVGLLAACVAVLMVGRSLLNEPQPTEQATIDQSSANFEPQKPTLNETSVTEPEGALAVEKEPAQLSADLAPSADAGSTLPTNVTPAPVVEAALESGDSSANTEVSEATQLEEDSEVEPSTGYQKSQIPALQGAVAAELQLSEAVDIQLTVDGTRVFSGRHEAGTIDLKFNKRAEIFVQDGSKAVLKYSGWSHGALGQAGRKRRIVLNAEPFQ